MEQIVRAILNSRTVSLEPAEESFDIYGFKCLGVAEKPVDIENISDSLVYIWHVKSDILPVSSNEIERWSIDAPGDRHWILSEREIPVDLFEDFPVNFRVIIWGPEKLSRWIGESVLRGDLIVGSNSINRILDQNLSTDSIQINEKTENKFKVVVAPGPGEIKEALSINALCVLDNGKALDISQLAALIKDSSFVVANDTGPAHMTAHLGSKGIALFGSHTSPFKVSIERENFKAIQAPELSKLSAEKVFERLSSSIS